MVDWCNALIVGVAVVVGVVVGSFITFILMRSGMRFMKAGLGVLLVLLLCGGAVADEFDSATFTPGTTDRVITFNEDMMDGVGLNPDDTIPLSNTMNWDVSDDIQDLIPATKDNYVLPIQFTIPESILGYQWDVLPNGGFELPTMTGVGQFQGHALDQVRAVFRLFLCVVLMMLFIKKVWTTLRQY